MCHYLKAKGFVFLFLIVWFSDDNIQLALTNPCSLLNKKTHTKQNSFSYALAPFSLRKQPFLKDWKSRQGFTYIVNILSIRFYQIISMKGRPNTVCRPQNPTAKINEPLAAPEEQTPARWAKWLWVGKVTSAAQPPRRP